MRDELKERSLSQWRLYDWEMGRRPGGEDENEIRRVLVEEKEGREKEKKEDPP